MPFNFILMSSQVSMGQFWPRLLNSQMPQEMIPKTVRATCRVSRPSPVPAIVLPLQIHTAIIGVYLCIHVFKNGQVIVIKSACMKLYFSLQMDELKDIVGIIAFMPSFTHWGLNRFRCMVLIYFYNQFIPSSPKRKQILFN